MKIAKKERSSKLRLTTRDGKNGTYLFIKDPGGSYHAFLEVETKAALKDCGSTGDGTTRQRGKRLLRF